VDEAAVQEIKSDLKAANDKINDHEVKLVRLEESHKYITQMAEDVIGVTKELNTTMQNVQLAMIGIQGNMENLTTDMGDIKERMNKFEDDNNINVLSAIKKNWKTIVLALAFISYVMLSKYGIHI
jgi:chromosome segregation ATPase